MNEPSVLIPTTPQCSTCTWTGAKDQRDIAFDMFVGKHTTECIEHAESGRVGELISVLLFIVLTLNTLKYV